MNQYSKKDILDAHERIKPFIHNTPIITNATLNNELDSEIFFKCENFQKIGAFKMRGAANAILSNLKECKTHGVTTHSSGNHAQALARAASDLGVDAHIVMPKNAPQVKVKAVEGYGAKIKFCNPTLHDREITMQNIVDVEGKIPVHPYNQKEIIFGQATAAKELFDEIKNLDYVLVPVGGGGLLGGTLLSAHFFSSKTKVIACEPKGADDAYLSWIHKKPLPQDNPKTIADGLRTSLGDLNFNLLSLYVDEVVTVSENAIVDAMQYIFERLKIVVEPSAAVPLAFLFENKTFAKNKRIGVILSGGNVDMNTFFNSIRNSPL
jgi:threonine dehydratase